MATSPYIVDVTQATFDDLVVKKSHQLPVLVDFWAGWCAPCKMLMPVLAKLADEYAGKFLLAKVDTDEEQALAGKYGIRGLPTVKLFKNGAPVGEFSGAQPERAVRALLDKHIARASDAALAQALAQAARGDTAGALAALQAAAADDPANDRVKLELARLLLSTGHIDAAEAQLKALPLPAYEQADAAALRARIEFARIAAEPDAASAAPANDSEARYRLAAQQVLAEKYDLALANLLEIVRGDRRFRDDAARKAMLNVFNLLGTQHELTKRYRGLLSLALN